MDFLKRQMFLIVCMVVSAAGIALGFTGLKGMPKIMEQMRLAEGVYRNLDNLRSKPVNQERLEAEQQRIDLVIADRNQVIERAKTLYQYDLMELDSLPYGNNISRLNFRKKYRDQMNTLLRTLRWGGLPSGADVNLMHDKIEDERAEKLYDHAGPAYTPAGILTRTGILQNSRARAALWNAQRIYCYAVNFGNSQTINNIYPSLWYEPSMVDVDTADPPYPDEVWRAQLSYWIQKDVVHAITELNDNAAETAKQNGEQPWVGIMPVKDIISIRLSDIFIPQEGDDVYGNPAGGTGEALPPGTPNTVFTQSGSGDAFDVLQFTLKLVMDVRDIPLLVEKICNHKMHTLLRTVYKKIPLDKKMEGKIYGSEPAVNVVMDFETILLGEIFRRWMPQAVRDDSDTICRDQDECVDEE